MQHLFVSMAQARQFCGVVLPPTKQAHGADRDGMGNESGQKL
jgi:hypothetical protein